MCIKSLQNQRTTLFKISNLVNMMCMHLCIYGLSTGQDSDPLTPPTSSKSFFGSLYYLRHEHSSSEAHQYFRTERITFNQKHCKTIIENTHSSFTLTTYFQPFMRFLDSLLIIFLPPIMAILPKVSQYFSIKQKKRATWARNETFQ